MLRPRQTITPGRRHRAGFTLIELVEVILAISFAVWLASRLAGHFHGVWRVVVFGTVALVGTLVLSVSLIIGFGYIFAYVEHRVSHKTTHESETPDGGQ
jgi:hypothetical protein